MLDIPPLGAAATLLKSTDSRRNQISAQGDPRRAGEVASGANLSSGSYFDRDYKMRVQDEYVRLTQRFPIFKGV
jgi:AraC-like DNA-binding protein